MAYSYNASYASADNRIDKNLFPEELWPALEGEEGDEVRKNINRSMQKKALMLGGAKDPNEKSNKLNKILNATGEDEDAEDEDDEEGEEAQADSDFGDEDGGDYDAEQYFDGGDGGDDDEGDGGGGGDDNF